MSQMNKDALRKFYEQIMKIFGIEMGDDEFLNIYLLDTAGNKTPVPMMVNNLPVIFPTDGVLRDGKWSDRVAFHPISESTIRGVSPVLQSTVTGFKIKVLQAICYISHYMVKLAKETKDGTVKHISPDLAKALTVLPKTIDDKSLQFINKVFAQNNDTDKSVVKVCMKRNGYIAGIEQKRTTSIYFPIYEDVCRAVEEKSSEVWGVTASRKTDVLLLKELLELILPDLDDPDRYTGGTLHTHALFLESLILAAAKVQESINNALSLLDKHIPDLMRGALTANTDFLEEIGDLKVYRNVIPPLRYNEGALEKDELDDEDAPVSERQVEEKVVKNDLPDFKAKAAESVQRANNQQARNFNTRIRNDDSLTELERRDPLRAEREYGSARRQEERDDRYRSRYDERYERRDDRFDRRRDDRYDDRRRDDRYSDRRSRYDDRDDRRSRYDDRYDDRGRGRYDDRDDRDERRPTSWSDRRDLDDRRDRSRGRSRRR